MKASPPTSIEAYIASFPPDIQVLLQKVRQAIRKVAPQAEETIKYQIPTFVQGINLVHFAAFQNHLGFYPTPSAIDAFREELKDYKHAKGSIQFPFDQPIPFDLIRRIVEFRVKEIAAKATPRKRR